MKSKTVNEFDDKVKITNPGDFIPQKIENVLEVTFCGKTLVKYMTAYSDVLKNNKYLVVNIQGNSHMLKYLKGLEIEIHNLYCPDK